MERPWSGAATARAVSGAVWGPKLLNYYCRPEEIDTKEHGKMLKKRSSHLKKETCLTETREGGEWRGETEELPGKSARGFGRDLKLEVSWHKKLGAKLPKRECWKTEEHCLKSRVIQSSNAKPCTKITFSAVG